MKYLMSTITPVKGVISVLLLSFSSVNISMAAGVSLSATRLIYPVGEKQVSINVKNSAVKESFLVQSWVSDSQGQKSSDFIVTPPLFILKAGKINVLRIIYNGPALPQDRESVFYLNNKAIPSTENKIKGINTLQIATQSVIKLFMRPQQLSVRPADAPGMLRCRFTNGKLTISNPSPYFVTLVNFTVDGKKQRNAMVPPMNDQTMPVSGTVKSTVSFQSLNDFGALTSSVSCKA